MKTALRKAMSLLLAVMMIFGTAALGYAESEEGECEPPGSFDVWEDEEVPTLNPGSPDKPSEEETDPVIPDDVATSGTCGDKLTWTFDESTNILTINGTGKMYDLGGSYAIPWYVHRDNIKSVIIENGVTSIGNYVFADCDNITSVTIPNSVTSIGDEAFRSCDSLVSITIPDSVTSIGNIAFWTCDSLKTVKIGSGVKTIGDSVFKDCYSLESITVDSNNTSYSNDKYGVLFDKTKTNLIKYPVGNTRTSYVVPDSVINISNYAFWGSHILTDITLGSRVTLIGEYAFRECYRLKSITFPDSVKEIGQGAFHICSSLTNVTIGNGVTIIDDAAFGNCDSLTNVFVPSSVSSIGRDAFAWCDNLTKITVDSANSVYSSDEIGALYNKDKTILIQYPIGNKTTSYEIPDSVISIDNGAFEYCENLINITIPDSVTSIGDDAFSYCENLANITIPDSVTSIGESAFINCYGITSITIGRGISNIGEYAFSNCKNIKDVYYGGSKKQWDSLTVGDFNTYLTSATIHYSLYNITWVVDGKQTAQEVKVGSKITAPANPTKSGYVFKGWSPAVPATMPEKDMTFTAVFEKVVYNVTWVVDGKQTTQEVKVGAKITPPANPTKSGYTFKGWSPAVPATMPEKDMTFTAVFEKIPEKNIYNLGEETYSFTNFGDDDSEGGHCFGMSVTSSGYYINELDIAVAGAKNGQTLYSLKSTEKVREPICYYQQIQDEFSINSTVAGGSAYLTGRNNIASDWNEVVNYVKNHAYDGKGSLQIGFRGVYSVKGELYSGGHAINFLRYEEVNGQPRIYAYDCNFPNVETYFYKDSDGNIKQAPEETFNVSITCIAFRSIPKYFELAGGYNPMNYIYAPVDTITISGTSGYIMEGTINGVEYAMYKVPEKAEQVIIKPLVDNAEFTYIDESYSFGKVNDDTLGVFTVATGDHGASNVGLEIVNVGFDIRTPSTTSITYGDSIILHADVDYLPEGAKIVWTADNNNFTYTASADGSTCTVSPSANGDTTFTATVVDSNGNEIGSDTQTMTAKAGFFRKIIAFFKSLFGLTKVIPEVFKF